MSRNQQKISPPSLVLPLLWLGVAGHGAMALAQSPGTFTAVGSMSIPRARHTATLLTNGKVLIAGGRTSGSPSSAQTLLASAELYDPGTRTFTPTGDMTSPRTGHTATLLPDGTVLIIGGSSQFAERYDPATGTFRAIGGVGAPASLYCHAATLLSNGKVLVTIGTWWPGPIALGIPAELYDPIDGTFAATGLSITSHSYISTCPTATLLPDGRALVTWEDPDAELYSPDNGSFGPAGDMIIREGYAGYTATLMTTGTVLIAGQGDHGALGSAELYDPAAGTFNLTRDLNKARSRHTATPLPDGSILIVGGSGPLQPSLADAELYDPATGIFSVTGAMATSRSSHTATLLPDGTVLLTGGISSDYESMVASAELYNPAVLTAAPVLFSLSRDGLGQGAIWHASTGEIASANDPAVAGQVLSMYTTSLVERGVIPPQVAIGGRLAEILFFGDAPGYPGYYQVNFRMPPGVAPGPVVPVRLTYLTRPSNEVTIGVR